MPIGMPEVSRLATVAPALFAALALAALVSHDVSRRAVVARHRSVLLSSPSSVLVAGSPSVARWTHPARLRKLKGLVATMLALCCWEGCHHYFTH